MREDYQELIDEVSALLGTPATLEGRDFGLIAFGAHTSHDGDSPDLALDPVRTRSILQRRSTSQVRAWFESFGITRVTGPVRIPPDPSAGVVHGRICLPVRHGGVAHGYIWLLDDSELELDDARMTAAMTTAARIGTLLAAEARAHARTGELLQQLLTGAGGPRSLDETAAELRGALGATASGPLALVAVTPWRTGDSAQERAATAGLPGIAAQCVLQATPAAGAAGGEQAAGYEEAAPDRTGSEGEGAGPATLAALVRLRAPDGLAPARAAAEALLRSPCAAAPPVSSPHGTAPGAAGGAAGGAAPRSEQAAAGVSAPRTGMAQLRTAWGEARAAARAARAESALGPVAEWSAIGPFRLLTALTDGARPDPVLRTLRLPVHRELARTAEVFLDHAGQAGRTAAALGIHRQTLYYRLSRVEQLTGLDLDDGEHRLLLHMALKTQRLQAG